MTKSQLIDLVANRAGVSRQVAERAINATFESIERALVAGRRVEIRGFGTLKPKRYRPHTAHNPRTGEKIPVSEKVKPRFRMSKVLLHRLNPGLAQN
jgi:nucleoid DNA-binding protein